MNKGTQQPADFVRTAYLTPATLEDVGPAPSPEEVAQLFLRLHGDSIRFVRDADCWFVWRGGRWEAGSSWLRVALRSFDVAVAQRAVAEHIDHPDADVKWPLADCLPDEIFETAPGRLERLERLLRHRPEVTVQTERFDGDPISISFRNWFIGWVERLPYAALARSPMLGFDDFRVDLRATLEARRAERAQVAA